MPAVCKIPIMKLQNYLAAQMIVHTIIIPALENEIRAEIDSINFFLLFIFVQYKFQFDRIGIKIIRQLPR